MLSEVNGYTILGKGIEGKKTEPPDDAPTMVSYKDRKAFAADLKTIYQASDEQTA